jgi:hypothetical protein
VQAQKNHPFREPGIAQDMGAMNALQNDRMIVLQKIIWKLVIGPGANDIRKVVGESLMSLVSGIILDFDTVFIQFILFTAPVFKTMQMNFYSLLKKCFYLEEQVEYPAVIHRIGNVQANNMCVFLQGLTK